MSPHSDVLLLTYLLAGVVQGSEAAVPLPIRYRRLCHQDTSIHYRGNFQLHHTEAEYAMRHGIRAQDNLDMAL